MTLDEIDAFWLIARFQSGVQGDAVPPAWAFGGDDEADEIARRVVDGEKTATTAAAWAFEADGVPMPAPGDLAIILDARSHPRALIRTTDVRVVPFGEVDESHAKADGALSLAQWRAEHAEFLRADPAHPFTDDMALVLETFDVLHPTVR